MCVCVFVCAYSAPSPPPTPLFFCRRPVHVWEQNTWMWSLKDYIDRKFMAQFPHPDRDLDVEEPLDAPDTTYAVPDITAIAETS